MMYCTCGQQSRCVRLQIIQRLSDYGVILIVLHIIVTVPRKMVGSERTLDYRGSTVYSKTSVIQHLYNLTFSLIQPSYQVQSP